MKELLRKRGFLVEVVAVAIDVNPQTITRWTDNAPIGKLLAISKFTGIPIMEIIDCFRIYSKDDGGVENS